MKKSFMTLLLSLIVSFPIFSQSGKYIEFDGQERYMTIPNHDDLNFSTSESFTVTFWLNVNSYVRNARFVAKRNPSTGNKTGYEIWGSNSANNFFALNTPNSSGTNKFSKWGTIAGATGEWIHLAMVVERKNGTTTVYQYQNGEVAKQSTGINMNDYYVDNTSDVFVGKGEYGGGLLNGKMDNLRFYKKALSKEELKQDMTSTVTASTDGLVAGYDFESIKNNTAIDITGKHNGTIFPLTTEGNVMIKSTVVSQDANFTGRGNDNEEILKVKLLTSGSNEATINNIKLKMTGTTDINDVEEIKIYTTKKNAKFDPRNPTGKGAILLGTATPSNNEVTVSTTEKLYSGTNYLWITYKIKETAKEGNNVDAELVSITTENGIYVVNNGNPSGNRQILLGRKLLFSPSDYNSKNYRIPAICTAKDGSLVTITDKRKNNSSDLPQDIDLVCKRSTDGGKTWSEPVTVAQGKGYGKGFGDACLIVAKSGKIVALFVGGRQFQGSTASDPIKSYMSTSDDNGVTWTEPVNLTDQLLGSKCPDPLRSKWNGSFFGSGHGLCTKSGRLMAVMTVKPQSGSYQNYVIYSDDEGTTWKVSKKAIDGGDEAKVVELNNGDILMSSRTQGNRLWAKSTDGGITWGSKKSWSQISGNACDADIIRYTSIREGYDKNRMLHTLPNAGDRRKVSMWVSYNEGKTWPYKKVLCKGTSAYSSVTILDDGTIGVYLEEDGTVPYKMYFLNFSLNWLRNGQDTYKAPNKKVEVALSSIVSGNYDSPQTVELTSATVGAEIYYTTDGSVPTTSSTKYTAPFEISQSTVLKAVAVHKSITDPSIVTVYNYSFRVATPTFTVTEEGEESKKIEISTATKGATIYYTLDGSTPTKNSKKYTGSIEINKSTTIKAIAVKEELETSEIASETYNIGWVVPGQKRPVGSDRYVVSATTEDAEKNIIYLADKAPASYYTLNSGLIEVKKGKTFTLKLEGLKNQNDGLQYCQAIILVDWNRDFKFTENERIAIIGKRATDNGNTVLDIAQEITVPNDAQAQKPTRLRVVYTDGWRGSSADLGEDPVDKGRVYDFDIKVLSNESGFTDMTLENVSITPNPVKDILKINFPTTNKYSVHILSLDGKILETQNVYAKNINLNVNKYQSNVYMLHIQDEEGKNTTIKMIKE